ncbi:glycoside hydrolase family 88 protein [Marinoscillum sp. MHG1-6]|uniref:glycoside hydrolase family 88 protein n=1 Tax=Marinoscillum sp. MHG1-6 TaxID=2959627 RepID=UPI0021587E49|nr:glycoside hydrolase family 88 protein [Marinoscillum sp. MHG1-6]
MKRYYFRTLWCVVMIALSACGEHAGDSNTDWVEKSIHMAATQYKELMSDLPEGQFPKTYENSELKTSSSDWWCSGFYPGTLLYLYQATGDAVLYREALKKLRVLEKEQFNTTTHDLGFMMFCSFGNALKVSGDKRFEDIIYTSSKSLATRFNPSVGTIRSWDPAPWNDKWAYPVIIDNMMNLEMLLWAGKSYEDSALIKVAITHADTTLINHFRQDYSSYHVVSYDTITGEVEMKNTDQGYADESSWARGQAWGLYGFTVMYQYTKDPKYLEHATGIANFILNHPNLPEDKIPYWDFNAPDIPNAKRDASAAAVIASALLKLKDYVDQEYSEQLFTEAEKILRTLSSREYFSEDGTNGGFILKHCVGNMPDNTEVDVPLSYADYYYVEALLRYQSDRSEEEFKNE